jgi:CPA2 family monovalent cation:H+ antiporter-2
MPHHTPLIATIVTGLALAFVFGALAHRLRISPLVGYLVAGIAIGSHTPGFVADQELANELAEIGVILLMFGVGLHFSIKELWAVRTIAVPGAVVQIAVATLLGAALAHMLGWSAGAGLVFGLALSVASTVVLLRALQERRLVTTERGQIAVGWLIVEDLVMVLTLVLLPAVAPLLGGNDGQNTNPSTLDISQLLSTVAITIGKVAAFVAIMMLVGRRVIPWILHYTAHTGSRELFRLAVLSIALGVAFIAANLFGVSFALGAFFAGLILSESQLSQQAANESLPLRDAFAVLFFVSVGMLFDPNILLTQPLAVAATLLIIVIGKSLAAFAIVRAFGHPLGTAFTISASLAQIGEFSFILAALGMALDLLPSEGRDLILAGALLSIVLNPLFFWGLDHLKPWLEKKDAHHHEPGEEATPEDEKKDDEEPVHVTTLEGHTIVVGIGRVGKRIIDTLAAGPVPLYVIDESDEEIKRLNARNIEGVAGSAATLLYAANPAKAASMIVAIPSNFEAGEAIEQARAANPTMPIIGRAQNEPEAEYLMKYGATDVVITSDTLAEAMLTTYRKAASGV